MAQGESNSFPSVHGRPCSYVDAAFSTLPEASLFDNVRRCPPAQMSEMVSTRCDRVMRTPGLLTFAMRTKVVLRWRHEHEDDAARLARAAATTRLGAESTRLETAGHRRGPRRDARRRQPMAQAGTRAGRGRTAPPSRPWSAAAPERRATRPAARPGRTRSAGVRLPRAGVDLQAGGRGDPPHVWRHLSPPARQPTPACRTAQRAAPGGAGDAAQRGRHPGLVAGAVALPGTKPSPGKPAQQGAG